MRYCGTPRPSRWWPAWRRPPRCPVARLPLADGVLLGMSKFRRILDIDIANRCAVVQPGVTNLAITHAVQDQGFY